MIIFWILAAAASAGAALLISLRAAVAARQAAGGGEDPTLALHRRQLADLDGQAARGLLGEAELAAARAEAGRRLLAAAEHGTDPERPGGRPSRLATSLAGGAAAVGALGLYLAVGRPGAPDLPYAQRLAAWRASDPATLDPARMAAVLSLIVQERPGDAQALDYLGRAQLAAGAPGEAARAFAQAARLAPADADYPAQEGEALTVGAQDKVDAQAEAAFREALRRDPKNPAARFHLARLRMANGDVAGGLADWRALAADLPSGDPRRAALQAEIDAASGPGVEGPSPAQVASAAQASAADAPQQAAFIQAMVDRLAARLASAPDDVDGWTRLVRAYRVLGDRAAQDKALARARVLYAGRPADLTRIEAAR